MKPLLKLFITSLLVLILVPLIGIKDQNWNIIFFSTLNPLDLNILQSIRIPRTLLAFLAGATLSLSGLCFQTIFQNLLATPFTLGITSSASFGASLTILLLSLFPSLALNGFLTPLIGAIGATLVTVVLVSILLNFRFFHSNQTVILLGVVLNIFFSQLISLIQFFASSESTVVEILRWFTGSIPVITNFQLLLLFYNFCIYIYLPLFKEQRA